MRRVLSFCLCLPLVLPLAACGGSTPPDAASASPDAGAPSAPASAARALAADGPTDLRFQPGEAQPLRAVLTEGGRPLPGVAVVFSFQGADAGASLSALR